MLTQRLDLPMPDEDFNIAPTTFQPIIRQSRASGRGWGVAFMTTWAKVW